MEHVITDANTNEKFFVPFTQQEMLAAENAKVLSKPKLKAFAANHRWRVEIGGCPWGDSIISTDRESQPKLTAAFLEIGAGLRSDGDGWKFADGKYRSLTNAEASAMIAAALGHIKKAFAVEASVLADIEAGNITKSDHVIAAGWPPNV